MSTPSDEIAALISDHLDGLIDDAGAARLETWLAAERAHQERFLRMVMDHRALLAHYAMARHQRRPRSARTRRAPALALLGALAALLALAVLWWRAPLGARRTEVVDPAGATFALLLEGGGESVLRAGAPVAIARGDALRPGDRITVAGGASCALRCPDGTVLRLADDAELELVATAPAKQLLLRRGRLEAEFSPQPPGQPAVIATPEAEVTVRGTALTVVSREGESRAEVSHGLVTLTRRSDHAVVPLAAGEYAIAAPQLALVARARGEPSGARYAVGAGQAYAGLGELPALHPGDVVELHPGSHQGAYRFSANGTALRPITVRGVGAAPAVVTGAGLRPGIGALPHALFEIAGAHLTIEHLDFAEARNGGTAAGILIGVHAHHTVIRGCRITRCDKGIEAEDDDLVIEDCEIGEIGALENDGFCHGLLLAGARAWVRHCDIHDCHHGQGIKCRSAFLLLQDCRLTDAEDGELGIVDPPAGPVPDSDVVVVGTLIASKPARRGNQQRFIEVESDAGGSRRGTLYLLNDTLVAADGRNLFINTAHAAMRTVAQNTIFFGSERIAQLGQGGFSARGCWMPSTAASPPGTADGVPAGAAGPGFVDAARRDFRLRADAACRGRGVDTAAARAQAGGAPAPGFAPGRTTAAAGARVSAAADVGAYPALP